MAKTFNQIPSGMTWSTAGPNGSTLLSQQAAFYLQQLQQSLAPIGSGYVIDGSNSSYGQMIISQGADSNKGTPTYGAIYIALDTGKIYVANGSSWLIQIPAFSGDVFSSANSTTLTLNDVNPNPGHYGNSSTIPVFNVNAKGLITGITEVPLTPPPAAVNIVDIGVTPTTYNVLFTPLDTGIAGGLNVSMTTLTYNPVVGLTIVPALKLESALIDSTSSPGNNGWMLSSTSTATKWSPVVTQNVISVPTEIPVNTTYIVSSYLDIDSAFDVDGITEII